MVHSMKQYISSNPVCISSIGVGESERAMLEYFGGILTQREEVRKDPDCDQLIVAGNRVFLENNSPGPGWTKAWEGHRPGENKTIFALFKRNNNGSREHESR